MKCSRVLIKFHEEGKIKSRQIIENGVGINGIIIRPAVKTTGIIF